MLNFITRNKAKPFLVYYPITLPHFPFVTTPDNLTAKSKQEKFGAMVEYLDKLVGKVSNHLDDLGIAENTLFMFTSDNGTMRKIYSMANGVLVEGRKAYPVDAGHHVPFIVKWPGTIKAQQSNSEIFDFNIFFPTLLEVAGIPVTDAMDLDGKSILPDLIGDKTSSNGWAYIYYDAMIGKFAKAVMALNAEYKLFDDGRFYNIKKDIKQLSPIAAKDRSKLENEILKKLQKVLDTKGKPDT